MKFNAVDLTRMTLNGLRFHPQPLSQWPVVEIDVDEVKEKTCIASWRWDVYSLNEISEGVSECAWDALHLGFSYLLVDIISLPQADLNIIQKVIEFSQLYESLHAVIAYKVDPQLKRAWLKNEAYKILNSPTQLWY